MAMGGPTVPVGIGNATAQDLADILELLLNSLTHPGSRVYPPEINRDWFWCNLVNILEQQ